MARQCVPSGAYDRQTDRLQLWRLRTGFERPAEFQDGDGLEPEFECVRRRGSWEWTKSDDR
jgi:hypothetical protein